MWKKVAALMGSVIFGLSVSTASLAADAPYEEGVNYEVRTDKLTPYKEIREFFSFWCGHCFALQGDFDRIKDAFPNAKFERNPVAMLGGPMGPESQRAIAVAQNLGFEDIFVNYLFTQMHQAGNIPMSHADMVAIAVGSGIPQTRFEQEYNSFPIIGKVAQFDRWGQDINIEAVPEILVNGKYLVTMESVENVDQMIDLIGYLLEKDNLPDAPQGKPQVTTKAK